ncbi:hypothetical protein TNCV_3031921 [Trichonephila clavipes]|nr:hypothetical protein TNCV_3031921 [Trichonephila clavipes]
MTLTEEFIIHPSVYSEIEKLGHAKSDVLLNESESSLGAHAYAYSILCKKANGAMKTSSVEFISQSPTPSPMNSNYRRPCLFRFLACFRFSSGLHEMPLRTAYGQAGRCGMQPKPSSLYAGASK